MQTHLIDKIKNTAEGNRADEILRNCVHCGFCNATCPTYQLTGDELDGPRGRIYLIKNMLETDTAGASTRLHLDRCLTCLNCQTTCPSGVDYGHLLEIGRHWIEKETTRKLQERVIRKLLRTVLPYKKRFNFFLRLGQSFKFLLPLKIKNKIPSRKNNNKLKNAASLHSRHMLLLEGCVQPGLSPETNQAARDVFSRLGITLINADNAGCCGAVSHHLSATDDARQFARDNIDAWWPFIEKGAETIIVTASGCGLMLKDYAGLMENDSDYAEKAKVISALAKDPVEVLENENLSDFQLNHTKEIVFHPPCTLQHGQKLAGRTEALLSSLGYQLQSIQDSHLCCGSAGTYSILQADLSRQLLDNKLNHLLATQPTLIATANVGCQQHLQTGTDIPVIHWLELLK